MGGGSGIERQKQRHTLLTRNARVEINTFILLAATFINDVRCAFCFLPPLRFQPFKTVARVMRNLFGSKGNTYVCVSYVPQTLTYTFYIVNNVYLVITRHVEHAKEGL